MTRTCSINFQTLKDDNHWHLKLFHRYAIESSNTPLKQSVNAVRLMTLIVKAQALLTLPPQTRPSNKPIPCSSYPDARDPMFTEYLLPVTAPQVLSKFPDSTSTKLIAMQLFQKVGFIAIPSLHVRSCIAFCKDKQILTPRNGMLVPTELSAANT